MTGTSEAKMSWKGGGCHCGAVRFEVLAPDEIDVVDWLLEMLDLPARDNLPRQVEIGGDGVETDAIDSL